MTATSLALLLTLAAPGQARPAPTKAAAAPSRVEYYLSEGRVLSPEGKALGALAGLVSREYDPARNTITEMTIAIDPAPDALPTVVVLEWSVSGGTAEIAERKGRVSGRARLVGPPWAWTEWSWAGTMKDVPGTFRNAAKLTRRGVSIRSERLDPAGKRVEVYDQVDTRISRATYEVLRDRLLPR